MGDSEGPSGLGVLDTATSTWTAVFAALFLLSLAAGWLTNSADDIRQSAVSARLAEAHQLESRKLHEAAAIAFRRSLAIDPSSFEARLGLARNLLLVQHWQEAQRHLANLRQHDPTSGPVHLLTARALRMQGVPDEASDAYQRAVYGYWPDQRSAERLAARLEWVRFLSARPDRSTLLAELVRLQRDLAPDSPIRLELARILLNAERPDEAANLFRMVLALDRKNGPAWQGLGDAELTAGRLTEARRAYASALSLTPSLAELQDKLKLLASVESMDPLQRRIGRAERDRRAAALLDAVAHELNSCAGMAGPVDRESVRRLLAIQKPDNWEAQLDLAELLWAERNRVCPPLARTQSPLPFLFEGLEKRQ